MIFFVPRVDQNSSKVRKKSLLKAIKEIEFDREMRKMSDKDADELTRHYRMRAIEVIKRLETQGDASSVDAEIDREVRARLKVDALAKKIRGTQQSRSKQELPSGNATGEQGE